MTAQELIQQLQKAGIVLEADAGEIIYRGPRDTVTAELLHALRSRKPEVLEELYRRQEHEREAQADHYWRRLQEVYDRAGRPSGEAWLTDAVRVAERRTEQAWLRARAEQTQKAHQESLKALRCWYSMVRKAIAGAERGG